MPESDGNWTVMLIGESGELTVEGVKGTEEADVTVHDPSSGKATSANSAKAKADCGSPLTFSFR